MTILKAIQKKTALQLLSINLLSTVAFEGKQKYFYHAALTADNLNNIRRTENQSLDFFTLQEIEKLPLTGAIKFFLSDNQTTIKQILQSYAI